MPNRLSYIKTREATSYRVVEGSNQKMEQVKVAPFAWKQTQKHKLDIFQTTL
jgi:hypothetical protein